MVMENVGMGIINKKVGKISFGVLSPTVIKKMASAKVVTPELYDKEGYPVDGGLMDIRLGVIDPGLRCKTCGGKAYRGRIGICETLEMTPEFEKIILGTISESAMRQEAKRQGMLTMYQDGILKVLQGIVSLEELLEIAQAGESA